MRSNYKNLGQFIQEISVKNKALNVELLLGVSITKRFIPSIANTVGTDMSTYKIVKRNQFAYGSVTSRNGEKISIALLTEDECLVSSSYTVFEVVDTEQLEPEYLMMWFRRSEFDRYARFMSHGTVREQFGWEDMCDVELPVPSIEKQREIVREYNVVTDRISLNEQLTQKLEDTAQAIYKQWFVHFEFPLPKEYADSIGKPELEGKPYKSSGGEMIFSEKMDSELPVIFNAIAIYDIADFVNGGAFKGAVFNDSSEGLPIIKIAELKQGVNSKTRFTNSVIDSKYFIDNDDILYSWSGNPETSLEVFKWFGGEAWLNQHIFKVNTDSLEKKIFVYYLLRELKPVFIALAQGKQTTGLGHVTVADMKKLYIPSCNDNVLSLFSESTSALYHYHSVCIKQRKALFKLLEIISIKMS